VATNVDNPIDLSPDFSLRAPIVKQHPTGITQGRHKVNDAMPELTRVVSPAISAICQGALCCRQPDFRPAE